MGQLKNVEPLSKIKRNIFYLLNNKSELKTSLKSLLFLGLAVTARRQLNSLQTSRDCLDRLFAVSKLIIDFLLAYAAQTDFSSLVNKIQLAAQKIEKHRVDLLPALKFSRASRIYQRQNIFEINKQTQLMTMVVEENCFISASSLLTFSVLIVDDRLVLCGTLLAQVKSATQLLSDKWRALSTNS